MEETHFAISTGSKGLSNLRERPGSPPGCPYLGEPHLVVQPSWYAAKSFRFVTILTCLLKDTDILYVRLLGKDMVVLSSDQAISDLIEKRSAIYSDRVSDPVIFTLRS